MKIEFSELVFMASGFRYFYIKKQYIRGPSLSHHKACVGTPAMFYCE